MTFARGLIPTIIFISIFTVPINYSGILPVNISSTMSSQDKWIADCMGIYYSLIAIYILIRYLVKGVSVKNKELLLYDYSKKLSSGDIDPITSPKIIGLFSLCLVLINLISIFFFTNPNLEKFASLYASIHSSTYVYFLFNLIVNNFMLLFLIMFIYFMEIEI